MWIVVTVLIAIALAITLMIMNNNVQHPSRVNASPLADLTENQIEHIEEIWESFKTYEGIHGFQVRESPNSPDVERTYSFWWDDRTTTAIPQQTLRVSASVSRDEVEAVNTMQRRIILREQFGERDTNFTFENSVDVALWHTFVDMPYGIPTLDREIWSEIRIGNVIISLRETRQAYNMKDEYSSKFIALLVEMLQD